MPWSYRPDTNDEERAPWSLYGTRHRPHAPRRGRWPLAVGLIGLLALVIVSIAVLTVRHGGRTSPVVATRSPVAVAYANLADRSLHGCDLADAPRFAGCVASFESGLQSVAFPSGTGHDVDRLRTALQLARTCVAAPSEDDPTLMGWPIGCPQQGPADRARAKQEDSDTRRGLYQVLVSEDATLHPDLGDPSGTPAN